MNMSHTRDNLLSQSFLSTHFHFSKEELVIHEDYGVGRFLGIEKLFVNNAYHDCIKLLYQGDDILYVPVENMNLIKKYGYYRNLDKLGSGNWSKRKNHQKKIIQEYSVNLLQLASKRQHIKLDKIKICEDKLDIFLQSANFKHTQDQINAINDIKETFLQGKLLNRLICGDVGSGKTEIAMSAIFFLLMHSRKMQVAFMCPTKVLCNQQFSVLQSRFQPFGFKVVELSNTSSKAMSSGIYNSIKRGDINIIVGTQSLLSDSMAFCNLRMVIIDEEQCFGVKQKSVLQNKYNFLHSIYLSATPIPRTLNMAIQKVYDISILSQKPFIEPKTHVTLINRDKDCIKKAVMKEIRRKGQVFYITPKILDIEKTYNFLQGVLPDLQIQYIHGRLKSDAIDSMMRQFKQGQIDILLSTTLVAFGIDIPNANTIIIENPYLLGLGQMYQLLGRVARGKNDGYAYFVVNNRAILSDAVKNRLNFIQNVQKSGHFGIAKEDLSKRGSGNILGEEQSGHLKDIGIELYHELINNYMSHNNMSNFIPIINSGLNIFFPKDYMPDEIDRIYFYNLVAKNPAQNSIKDVENQVIQQYGPMPDAVENFFLVAKIKSFCTELFIHKVSIGLTSLSIVFAYPYPNKEMILRFIKFTYDRYKQYKVSINNNKMVISTLSDRKHNINLLYSIFTSFALFR